MDDWRDVIIEVLAEILKGIIELITLKRRWKIIGVILITILSAVGQHMLKDSRLRVTPSPAVVIVTQIVTQRPAVGQSGSSNSSNLSTFQQKATQRPAGGRSRSLDSSSLSTPQRNAVDPAISPCENSPKRLQVGHQAQVCTWNSRENVILRTGPAKDYPEQRRLMPGAVVTITGKAVCDEETGWWYWPVRTRSGYTGWMAEGGDEKDPYFLCPYP